VAARSELITTLKTLTDYYTGQTIEKATLQIYLDHLADIPAWLLDLAARRHIRTSAWFPKISELRQHAAEIAGAADFAALQALPPDLLYRETRRLEDLFYRHNHLDPQEWQRLALRYDQAGRHCAAEACRQKLHALLQLVGVDGIDPDSSDLWTLIAAAQALEDAYYTAGRLDPLEWQTLADAFARLDRPHRSAHTLAKLRRLQSLQASRVHPLQAS
jgi:hypothetical protein